MARFWTKFTHETRSRLVSSMSCIAHPSCLLGSTSSQTPSEQQENSENTTTMAAAEVAVIVAIEAAYRGLIPANGLMEAVEGLATHGIFKTAAVDAQMTEASADAKSS